MVTHDPSPRNHEALHPIPFETGLQAAIEFLNEAERANELRGAERQRHFMEIRWNDYDELVDIRTYYRDATPRVIHSLATGTDELVPDGTHGFLGRLKRPGATKAYFEGNLVTAEAILGSFAQHIRTYSDGANLLHVAKPYSEVHETPSFSSYASRGLAKALAREPEHMRASHELLTEMQMSGLLAMGKFGPFLGRLLVRDLAPPGEEASQYDLNLSPAQKTAAIHGYESVYGFEPGIFSSPYAYRSFAFSEVLHQRLTHGNREEILTAVRNQPLQFAGMYIGAVLDTLAEDPTRNRDKLNGITRRILVRNNAGELVLSFNKLHSVAQAVADAQRQKTESAGENTSFELLNPDSLQTMGNSLSLLLSLTHDSNDAQLREVQRQQDRVHQEIVDMLLIPTTRNIGELTVRPTIGPEV